MPANKKAAKPAPKAKSKPTAKKPAPAAKKSAVKAAPAKKSAKPKAPLKKAPSKPAAKKAAVPVKKPAPAAKKAAAKKPAAPAKKAAPVAAKKAATKPAAAKKPTPAPAKKAVPAAKKAAAPAKKAAIKAPAAKAEPAKKPTPAAPAAPLATKVAAPAAKAPEPAKVEPAKKPTKKSSTPSVSVAGKPTVLGVGGKIQPIPNVKRVTQQEDDGPTIEIPREVKVTPFLRKQKQRLFDLRSALVESMEVVAEGSLRVAPEGSEANAFGMHQADAGSDAYDRDFALGLLSKEQDSLYEINEALERLDRGTYGICEKSGKPIPEIRLEALPFTRYTVECQAAIEKDNMGSRYRRPVRSLFGLDDAADETPEKDDEEEETETRKEDSDRADRSDA